VARRVIAGRELGGAECFANGEVDVGHLRTGAAPVQGRDRA
jgi:hypothetical protein